MKAALKRIPDVLSQGFISGPERNLTMNYRDLSDRELFKHCAEGSAEAWDFFVEKYSKLVYNSIHATLRKYSSDFLREDREDIYSQIFLSLLEDDCRRLRQFRGERNSTAASWLRVIAMNTTINYISRTKTHSSLDDGSETGMMARPQTDPPAPSVPELLNDAQEMKLLKLLIEKLDSEDKLIVRYHLEGLSSKEIGRIVHKSNNAVDSKLSRIRKKLKDILDTL
jgi:RNA polymerase sigma-70 factor (ECF subfamily)